MNVVITKAMHSFFIFIPILSCSYVRLFGAKKTIFYRPLSPLVRDAKIAEKGFLFAVERTANKKFQLLRNNRFPARKACRFFFFTLSGTKK
jgi:hypothetical protein